MMTNHGPRTVDDRLGPLEDTHEHVEIAAAADQRRGVERRVEETDAVEHVAPESHVAPGSEHRPFMRHHG
jgi:hypothetical protein